MQFAQTKAQTKNCKRVCFANPDKNCFLKITNTKKNKNTPTHGPTNTTDIDTETLYLQGIQRHDRQKASR